MLQVSLRMMSEVDMRKGIKAIRALLGVEMEPSSVEEPARAPVLAGAAAEEAGAS